MKKKKLLGVLLSAAIMISMLPSPVKAEGTTAASIATGAAKVGAAGFMNPGEIEADYYDGWNGWTGQYVYFGTFGYYPILFRVLDKASPYGGILLDSESAQFRTVYDADGDPAWSGSDLSSFLGGDYLLSSFSEPERKALVAANGNGLSGEKVFVLGKEDVENAAYGYGDEEKRKKYSMKFSSENVPWILRSGDDGLSLMGDDGKVTTGNATDMNWFCPAVVLNPANVVMTWPLMDYKPDNLSIVDVEDSCFLTLTLAGGSGFQAARVDSNKVPAGSSFTVNIVDIGQSDWSVTYSQISAMLLDKDNQILAYGSINDTAATGATTVTIPAGVPDGNYTLRVFAEDINSKEESSSTDFASNTVDLAVTVGSNDTVQSETTVNPEQTSSGSTKEKENAGTQNAPKPSSSSTADANKLTAHKITVNSGGNGKVEADAQTSTMGNIITLKATPDSGYHLKAWSSKEVLPSADGKFTMPDKDVTVTATFEKDAEKKYKVSVSDKLKGGKVAINKVEAAAGEKIELTVTPDKGWSFQSWNIPDVATDAEGKYFLMPAKDVVVNAVFCRNYSMTLKTKGEGTLEATPKDPAPGQEVTLIPKAYAGYHFEKWVSDEVKIGSSNRFVMPEQNVTIKAEFKEDVPEEYVVYSEILGSGTGTITYPYGTIYEPGDKVVVDTSPAAGCFCSSLTVTTNGRDGGSLSVDGDYFIMPSANVTITAVFEVYPTVQTVYQAPASSTPEPEPAGEPEEVVDFPDPDAAWDDDWDDDDSNG